MAFRLVQLFLHSSPVCQTHRPSYCSKRPHPRTVCRLCSLKIISYQRTWCGKGQNSSWRQASALWAIRSIEIRQEKSILIKDEHKHVSFSSSKPMTHISFSNCLTEETYNVGILQTQTVKLNYIVARCHVTHHMLPAGKYYDGGLSFFFCASAFASSSSNFLTSASSSSIFSIRMCVTLSTLVRTAISTEI